MIQELLERLASLVGITESSLVLIFITLLLMTIGAGLMCYLKSRRQSHKLFSRRITSQRKSKVYTKAGDKGYSSLCDNQRQLKSSPCFHVLGNIDELNSCLGHAIEHLSLEKMPENYLSQLQFIQSRLLDIGAVIADPEEETPKSQVYFKEAEKLESYIDEIESYLERLKTFVLPSGGLGATSVHLARTVCRRCERALVEYLGEKCQENGIGPYINRMSDYLFLLARLAAKNKGIKERMWQKCMN